MVGGGVMSGVWPSTPPYLLFSGDTSSVHGAVLAANLEWCCFVRGWLFLPLRRGGFVRGCLLQVAGSDFLSFFGVVLCCFMILLSRRGFPNLLRFAGFWYVVLYCIGVDC
ncbi:hypothetical protein QL285_048506 [Trifolium repens]|nr:hypothetical protein QL285_048506 [Trifolium repens]